MINESSHCRLCEGDLKEITYLCDSPPANNFDNTFQSEETPRAFPLILDFCNDCYNLQLRHCLGEDLLYENYTYVTPKSESLELHYKVLLDYAAQKIEKFSNIDVIEVGSNSGDLLKYFSKHVGSILGIDPAKNVSKIANESGVETLNSFFNIEVAKTITPIKKNIKLVMARHMFAHNANPSDLLDGMQYLLGDDGLLFIENAYAIDTLMHGEFDQIYHEHMFFYSVLSMKNLLSKHNLYLHDLLFSEVHGGSIIFIASSSNIGSTENLQKQILLEENLFQDNKIFNIFLNKINEVQSFINNIINDAEKNNLIIGAYGAPAKAFTMFSTLGLTSETIKFCVDTTPTKIGKIFPVSNIPIISEHQLSNYDYDILIVNAWNYKKDILAKSSNLFKKGTKLIFALPNPESVEV